MYSLDCKFCRLAMTLIDSRMSASETIPHSILYFQTLQKERNSHTITISMIQTGIYSIYDEWISIRVIRILDITTE